jgi:hypothetical protein
MSCISFTVIGNIVFKIKAIYLPVKAYGKDNFKMIKLWYNNS